MTLGKAGDIYCHGRWRVAMTKVLTSHQEVGHSIIKDVASWYNCAKYYMAVLF